MIDPALFNLPWLTLVTLASGYAGYHIANNGIHMDDRTANIFFPSLCFGLIGASFYKAAVYFGMVEPFPAIPAFLGTIIISALWRKYVRLWFYKILRKLDISHCDHTPSAWIQFSETLNTRSYELNVVLKDDTCLLSRDLYRFEDLPNGPYALGATGDIVLYVTDAHNPLQDEWREYDEVLNEEFGAYATYIPADQIKMVSLRRK
ncbi:hypothetical protein [Bartonella sp. DGB2]|uniref:hypothetical protein n=1 Tax=Bartonella sp. DGB2 TaxID=3388426 RepID=UPI00398FB983